MVVQILMTNKLSTKWSEVNLIVYILLLVILSKQYLAPRIR